MNHKLPCALVAASLLAPHQAPARLGETADKCDERYGESESAKAPPLVEVRRRYWGPKRHVKGVRIVTADFGRNLEETLKLVESLRYFPKAESLGGIESTKGLRA